MCSCSFDFCCSLDFVHVLNVFFILCFSLSDVPVWSKLETGRIPQPPELFQIIENQLQFQTKVELKPGFAK
jgi:hypothetical protein